MTRGTLIVGASQAGLQLAVSLREFDKSEPITIVGAEPHLPYQRPPLSKTYLAGEATEESLDLRTAAFYGNADIRLFCGERINNLTLSPNGQPGAGLATTDAGRSLAFDQLALTVGARPRRLPVPGAELDGICYLRDRDDATRLRLRLATAHNTVVVGGGFIGLEVAAVARSYTTTITIVEAAERLLSRSVAPVVSDFYRDAHRRRGTVIRTGAEVAAFHGKDGRVVAVELADGTTIDADVVLIGIGATPRTELAQQLGLDCDGGIVVDEFARTSRPSIVAAGDCTVCPNPLTGMGRVRLESVQHAISQARTAAATLAHMPQPYHAIPWFWSDQADLKLQIAGLSDGYDHYVIRGDPNSERFSVLYYRQDQIQAIDSINSAADYLAVRHALSRGANIPMSKAGNTDLALKTLIVDNVRLAHDT